MLEDRLSSAYSQQSLGYGAVPAPQYPSMYPTMPPPPVATDGKTGIENFYYGQPAAEAPPLSPTPYAQHRLERDVPDGTASTMSPGVYPQPSQPGPWNGATYPPHPVSPPPSNNFQSAYPGQAAPAQYYSTAPTVPGQDYTPRPGESETSYQPSPVVQRDSQYFPPAGPPSAPVPSAPEQPPPADQVQSPGYQQYQQQQIPEAPAMAMGGKPAPPQQQQPQQQPTVPPAQQSYYYPPPPQHQPQQQQPPPQTPMPSAPTYPPYAGTDVSPVSAPSTQYQPTRLPPVEESLIEL